MNLADPELELIDPTPNVHSMFLHFDRTFFWAQLSSRCVVRWSKRMYSCAGICSYEGRGGLCDIALSEPLLKLRPRKDMVETLLHEMIHAYLFVTNRDQDRNGHGPNFQAHMHRINRAAGLNISIYHDFHEEVELYMTHWWRCNGPCQFVRPNFGIVRRSVNKAPGPSDYWWKRHQRNCGGTFIKFKEPDKPIKTSKKTKVTKPNADITKYIINSNNNNKDASNKNIINDKTKKPILKDTSNVPVNPKAGIKTNNSTFIVTKKNVIFSPQVPKPKPIVFNGTGQTIGTKQSNNLEHKRTKSNDVLETVRNVWANKQLGTSNIKQISKDNSVVALHSTKHKPDYLIKTPPPKVKKIDDYFKTAATSVLKDLYGQNFNITQSNHDQKLKAIPSNHTFVACPVCNVKIELDKVHGHLDECLNKDVIKMLSKETTGIVKNEDKSVIAVSEIGIKKETVLIGNDHKKSKDVNSKSAKDNYIIDLTSINDLTNSKSLRKSFDQDNRTPSEINAEVKNHRESNKPDKHDGPTTSNIVNFSPVLHPQLQTEPNCSNSDTTKETACPCCGDKLNKSVDEHLDECLSFFENDKTVPHEGIIIIDDDFDDKFDESQTFNETGTKFPCPCCLVMTEERDMNSHLNECLVNESM